MKPTRPRLPGIALLLAAVLMSTTALAGRDHDHDRDDRHHDHRDHPARVAVEVGPRPAYLIDQLDNGPLKRKLASCENRPQRPTAFSIGHRGAALQFPEHTRESYIAAARQGAGIVECDVTFTQDRELVCRHSQCDLHTTTNILAIPELAAKCSVPFTPADPATGTPAQARCCTSDITLAEFRQLKGKMDGANPMATTVEDYMKGTPSWRTELYAATGTLMAHKESIALFRQLGVGMTPELKEASVPMPFQGDYTQADYAQQMIDEYVEMGVSPRQVWPQSFKLDDVLYWVRHTPRFGRQAVFLESVDSAADMPAAIDKLPTLARQGVNIVAPPLWALVTLDGNDRIVPSAYARAARAAGLDIITWTLERSGTLTDGGGWYYQSITGAIDGPGDTYRLLDVLARKVGVIGVFSDWPATVTYYANCMSR
ncbi:glycerophosphodiester phosphodiesterase family protein [Denitromonas iodatirespirans]|uniref:glycerophosphodiester phosphodiesterase n=1 Tax=Denitromonas iodatirespirans TaxID=2795389 RepID=A0A944DDV6_DENI1|nr:glycerophosphodiester phosphodiesterase family protein [Denitromonas iodatirespirans]MBT0963687.1 glycerophosphodiester phosphodiesterase [Denitromonas iodatirespirans]